MAAMSGGRPTDVAPFPRLFTDARYHTIRMYMCRVILTLETIDRSAIYPNSLPCAVSNSPCLPDSTDCGRLYRQLVDRRRKKHSEKIYKKC